MDSSDHVPLRDKRADNGIGHDWLISATGLVFSHRTYYVPPEIWLASLIGRLWLFIVYAD